MSPLGVVLDAWLDPRVVGVALFVGWWVLWFVLNQEFLKTLSMLLAARAVSTGGALLLTGSGALGDGPPAGDPGALAFLSAAAVAWLVVWGTEALVLHKIMQRRRSTWRWDGYDLAVLGAAHLLFFLVAAFLVR